ncbi:MAG: hypothetical protein WA484_02660 [Solirubrobacteraceae bacterium]
MARYLGFITACVAIGASLVAFFTVGDAHADLKVLVGFCIGLIAIVLTLQIEALVRLAERASTQELYGKLLAMVEDYPDLLPMITRTAEASVETLKASRVEPFRQCVPEFLTEAQVRLKELAQGRLYTTGGDKTLLPRVFANTTNLIQGTTDVDDTRWWQQAIGLEFLGLNKDLIKGKRKGKVERVWILEEPPPDETRRVIEDHRNADVTVFIVRVAELDDDLLVNMTMMDGWFLHLDVTNRLRRAGEYLFSENRDDLDRAEARFRRILAAATRYKGPESLDILFAAVDHRKPTDPVPGEEGAPT